jgi:phosphatidylserine/phosphatidylglycerophosphate/cardiolipin synthase-like enzyme
MTTQSQWLFETPTASYPEYETTLEPEWEARHRSVQSKRAAVVPIACINIGSPEVLDRFAFDQDILSSVHQTQIQKIAQCVFTSQSKAPTIQSIRLVGHTDPAGSDAYNLQLGQRRAEQVRNFLQQVIDSKQPGLSSRIQFIVETRGEKEPIPNDPARSRRVEIFLLRSQRPSSIPNRWRSVMGGKKARLGNQVDFLIDGAATYQAMVQAIKTATEKQHYIYLLGWWLTDCFPLISGDPNSTIFKLFTDASRRGVQIRVMLWDQFGTQNSAEVDRINKLANGGAILDNDTLKFGSHHQKLLVIRGNRGLLGFCGGVDINPDRVVSNPKQAFPGCSGRGSSNQVYTAESSPNIDRKVIINSSGGVSAQGSGVIAGAPFTDIHCRIQGPAAHDLLTTFIQRWQAHPKHQTIDRTKGKLRGLHERLPAPRGNHLVRIARTFNLINPKKCIKARSVRSTTIAAIRAARKFIYIEDQYLVSMEAAAELRKALPNIQHLTIVIPHSSITDLPQVWARRKAFIDFLKSGPHANKVQVFYLVNPKSGGFGPFTYVHTKTWIIDDELAIIGSANCNRRSWTYDSEVNALIYDPIPVGVGNLPFAQRLRIARWSKHLNVASALVKDGVTSAILWLKPPTGAWIRPYNQNAGKDPSSHKLISWDSFVDPSGDSNPVCPGGIETEVAIPLNTVSEFSPYSWDTATVLR